MSSLSAPLTYTYKLIWFMDEQLFSRDAVSHAILYCASTSDTKLDRIYSNGILDIVPPLNDKPKRREPPKHPAIWFADGVYQLYPGDAGQSNTWSGFANNFGKDRNETRTVTISDVDLIGLGKEWVDSNKNDSKVYPWNCRGAVDYVIAKVTRSVDTLEVFSEAKRLELGKIANVQ